MGDVPGALRPGFVPYSHKSQVSALPSTMGGDVSTMTQELHGTGIYIYMYVYYII